MLIIIKRKKQSNRGDKINTNQLIKRDISIKLKKGHF